MNRKQQRPTAKPGQTRGAVGKAATAADVAGRAELLAAGRAHHKMGRWAEAEAVYRQVLAIQPDHADTLHLLGALAFQTGRHADAVEYFQQAIQRNDRNPACFSNLGSALTSLGRHDEAIAAFRKAIAMRPDSAQTHYNLGVALGAQGKRDNAVAAYRRAIAIKPDHADAFLNLGIALKDQGKLDDAVAAYRSAIAIAPGSAQAHSNLGNALAGQNRFGEAVAAHRRAVEIEPYLAEAWFNLGNALAEQGVLDRAADAFREAMRLRPGYAAAHSSLLCCLNYRDDLTAAEIFAAHREWDAQIGRALPAAIDHANDSTPGRRLRVGYVSPDFRAHSVAYFLEPLLKQHDRQAVEIFCYAEVARPDAMTAHLRGLSDRWLTTVGLPDDALAERIRADRIDVLIDLAGHTANNRLAVLARKPAPVQVTWLGYPNTTGLEAIDCRLVDAVTDPAGAADACASEALVRLDGGFLCYGGATSAPEPAAPPCLTAGSVTFGSFNNPAKTSPATLRAWAALLARVPNARLLLKGRPFADADTRSYFTAQLAQHGVATERVELAGWRAGTAAHLAAYQLVDIALDPFPYNGTTTTCEALWMGVPVVTLRGDRHAGRVGASLLAQIGMANLIAGSVEDYVDIAVALAGNPQRLNDLRRTLRPRLAAAPLCDGRAFARRFEAALRGLWQDWCKTQAQR